MFCHSGGSETTEESGVGYNRATRPELVEGSGVEINNGYNL
jgi:hypothetical protein